MKNFFLFSLLILCFLSILVSYTSIKSSKWRSLQLSEQNGTVLRSSFGFWKICNETIAKESSNKTVKCGNVEFKDEQIMTNSRAINYVGFIFQIMGSLSIFCLFFIALCEYKLTLIWNLNVILSMICVSFFTIGLVLMIVSTTLFMSRAKYIEVNKKMIFYEPGFGSFALVGFTLSIFCGIGVLALNFIFLSTSTLKRTKKAADDSVEEPKSNLNQIKKNSSQKNFKFIRQPIFPNIPPPPPPTLSIEAKTSFGFINNE